MEEKSLGLAAEGQVGFRQEARREEGIRGRGSMGPKGPNDTSAAVRQTLPASLHLGQPYSWTRMGNTQVLTLAQKFLSLIVRTGSGKTVMSLKFTCTIAHFLVSNPPSSSVRSRQLS